MTRGWLVGLGVWTCYLLAENLFWAYVYSLFWGVTATWVIFLGCVMPPNILKCEIVGFSVAGCDVGHAETL